MRSQRGGIVIGWLAKVVIMLVIAGLALFEVGAVVVAKVGVDGTTETAAQEAAGIYGTSKNANEARTEAEAAAKQGGATLVEFSVSPDGKHVTVTLERIAKTRFIHKIGALKKFRIARATHTIKVQ